MMAPLIQWWLMVGVAKAVLAEPYEPWFDSIGSKEKQDDKEKKNE